MQSQLRWAGHVARLSDDRLPKRLLFGELQHGKRSQGGQKKRFKDTLKASLKAFNINHNTWEQSAQDRGTWRSAVHKGAKACEANRTAMVTEERRQVRKNRTAIPATAGYHSLSTLPETLSGADWPDPSPVDPQSPTTPTPGLLDGHR